MPAPDKSKIILEAVRLRSPIFLSADNIPVSFQSYIKSYQDDVVVIDNAIHPQYISTAVKAKRYFLQINMLRFESDRISSNGKDIIFPLKHEDTFENARSSERYSFGKDEHVICELLNPFDQRTLLRKTVMDLSTNGLALRNNESSQLFSPGIHFGQMTIYFGKDSYLKTSGAVIYVRKVMTKNGRSQNQIGIKFDREIAGFSHLT